MFKIIWSWKGTFHWSILKVLSIHTYLVIWWLIIGNEGSFFTYVLVIYFHILSVFSVCGGELNNQGRSTITCWICEFLKAEGNNWFTLVPLFSSLASIWVCFSPQKLQQEAICAQKEDRTNYMFMLKALQLSYQLIWSSEKHLMHSPKG